MNENKSLTLNGLNLQNFLFLLLSFGMMGVSLYLTNHYFQTMFPDGLAQSSSLCDISDYFSCDKTTRSIFGTILGVPTSFFGVLLGLMGMITSLTNSAAIERNTKLFFIVNALGCLFLLGYSLISLGSLCPMCTAYYVFSFAALALLLKHSKLGNRFEPQVFVPFSVAMLILSGIIGYQVSSKSEKNVQLTNSYIKQFEALKDYGDPTIESPFKLHAATEKFADAPIRISVFSDFQCPYCQKVGEQMIPIIAEFKENINIQYMFYPLDKSCNEKMEGSMHAYACQAAYLAACDKDKFVAAHDYIFENQSSISAENLKLWEEKFELSGCFDNEVNKAHIQQTMKTGAQFGLRSTPTIIINGKKIEGLIPTIHLREILKTLIK